MSTPQLMKSLDRILSTSGHSLRAYAPATARSLDVDMHASSDPPSRQNRRLSAMSRIPRHSTVAARWLPAARGCC